MAEAAESELIVLGAGPGGYAAAFLAADKGMRVTLIAKPKSTLHGSVAPITGAALPGSAVQASGI